MERQAELWWLKDYPRLRMKASDREALAAAVRRTEELCIVRKTVGKRETMNYDPHTQTWHYENRESRGRYDLTHTVSLRGDREWGSVTKRFPTHRSEEHWTLDHTSRTYEKVRVQGGMRTGFKSGRTTLNGATAIWTEDISSPLTSALLQRALPVLPLVTADSLPTGELRCPTQVYNLPTRRQPNSAETPYDTAATKADSQGEVVVDEEESGEVGETRCVEAVEQCGGALQELYRRQFTCAEKAVAVMEHLERGCSQRSRKCRLSLASLRPLSHSPLPQLIAQLSHLRTIHERIESYIYSRIPQLSITPKAIASEFSTEPSQDLMEIEELTALFEGFMDHKFVEDCGLFTEGLLPRAFFDSFTMYLSEKVVSHSDLPLTIWKVTNSLQRWSNAQNLYAELMAALCGLGAEPDSLYLFSLFLVRVRKEYWRLQRSYSSVSLGVGLRLLLDLFRGEMECWEIAAKWLKPAGFSLSDYELMLTAIKCQHGNTTEKKIEAVSATSSPLLSGENSEISGRTESLLSSLASEPVSEAQFLTSLKVAFHEKSQSVTTSLSASLSAAGPFPLRVSALPRLLSALDPTLTPQHRETLISAIASHSHLSADCIVSTLAQYPVSAVRKSVFGKRHTVLAETEWCSWRVLCST